MHASVYSPVKWGEDHFAFTAPTEWQDRETEVICWSGQAWSQAHPHDLLSGSCLLLLSTLLQYQVPRIMLVGVNRRVASEVVGVIASSPQGQTLLGRRVCFQSLQALLSPGTQMLGLRIQEAPPPGMRHETSAHLFLRELSGGHGPARQDGEPRDWLEQLRKETPLLWDSSMSLSLSLKTDSLMSVSPNPFRGPIIPFPFLTWAT